MQRVAMLSVHTSPLAQPGTGDGGGMNVYVRALGSALARAGVEVDVLHARRASRATPRGRRRAAGSGCCTCPQVRARRCACASSPNSSANSPTRRTGCSTSAAPTTCCTPTTGCRARSATGSSTSSTCRSSPRSTPSTGSRPRSGWPATCPCAHASRPRSCAAPTSSSHRHPKSRTSSCGTTAPIPLASRSSRPGSTTSCSTRAIAPPPVVTSRSRPDRSCSSSVACSHSRASTSRSARSPSSGSGGRRSWSSADRVVPTVPPRSPRCTLSSPSSGSNTACGSSPRILTSSSPTTTAPPTSCVVPSHTESFGLVALEAAACGTPVVAANVGGLRLLVDDGVTGYLVDRRDPLEYADADRTRAAATTATRCERTRWRTRRGTAGASPPRACAATTTTSRRARRSSAARPALDRPGARARRHPSRGSGRGRVVHPGRRVRPRAAPLVRALHLRRP